MNASITYNSRVLLNVHAILPVSCVNGPGRRAVVWTQGCSLRCPGCCNPQTHSHKPRLLLDAKAMADRISCIPGIEGLTISGGEPFEQALAVASLCRESRCKGLSVMVFAGWTYEQIRNSDDPAVHELLSYIDILVDGPFVQELADSSLVWRGSRNQHVRFLTNRYQPSVLQAPATPTVEMQFTSIEEGITVTGFPSSSDLDKLAAVLRQDGEILLERS